MLNKLKKIIYTITFKIINQIFVIIFPLKQNKILLLSDVRGVLGGNLQFVYDKIKNSKAYEIKIIFKADRSIKRTLKQNIELIYHLSISKYILLDDASHSVALMKVREGQEVCQLWHASGAFKTFGYSRNDREIKNQNDIWHYKYTKAFVSSENIRECYAEGFGIPLENVIAAGTPRTDVFFDEKLKSKTKKEILNKYPALKDKKIILFAPTYRGTSVSQATYDFDAIDYKFLYENLKDEYIFIFKWHPAIYWNIKDSLQKELSDMSDFYYDFSSDRDINDLLFIADILITDYSSVLFDWALLKKPIIYFVYDLYSYIVERGFYFKFSDYLYGPVIKTEDELVNAIKNAKFDNKKNQRFIKQFMGACDGNSTEKVIETILQ